MLPHAQLLTDEFVKNTFLLEEGNLVGSERETFLRKSINMDDVDATLSVYQLCGYLFRYYGKGVIKEGIRMSKTIQEKSRNAFTMDLCWD